MNFRCHRADLLGSKDGYKELQKLIQRDPRFISYFIVPARPISPIDGGHLSRFHYKRVEIV